MTPKSEPFLPSRPNQDSLSTERVLIVDPDATWISMIQAIIDDELETAADLANGLANWLERGGFSPSAFPEIRKAACDRTSPAFRLNRMVVLYVCARVRTDL